MLCVVCCVLFFVLPETEVDFLFIFLSSAFHIDFQAFTTSKKTYSHEIFVGDINNRVACYYAYTQPGHGKKNTVAVFFVPGRFFKSWSDLNAKRGLILKTLTFQKI